MLAGVKFPGGSCHPVAGNSFKSDSRTSIRYVVGGVCSLSVWEGSDAEDMSE